MVMRSATGPRFAGGVVFDLAQQLGFSGNRQWSLNRLFCDKIYPGEPCMKAAFALIVVGAALVAPAAMFAHHSFAAEYDVKKPVTLKGTVTKVEWTNPHARFYIDVKDESGNVTNWNLELASPNVLVRNGWSRHTLKEG